MQTRLIAAALACAVILPGCALAQVFNFSFTETSALLSGPVTYDFSLDTSTGMGTETGADFAGVIVERNGTVAAGGDVDASNGTNIANDKFFLVDTDVPTRDFYSGTGTDIVFNTGTFSIADGATDGEGTLTIAKASIAAAPEPRAWALMMLGVGFIGWALSFRKRALDDHQAKLTLIP